MDAEYFASTGDFRRMVLDAAIACEIEKDKSFECLWRCNRTGQYRRGKAQSGYELPRLLDADLERLAGKSLRVDEPEVFERIQNLWNARGNVAHGEPAQFRTTSGIEAVSSHSRQLLDGAASCVQWLRHTHL